VKKETVKQYTILYQYLLLLKEPAYIFLTQTFQHLSPVYWWEDYIEPVLQHERKENFKFLDFIDLINVLKMNWNTIFRYLDKGYQGPEYDSKYKLINKIHRIRTVVAHANESEMSPFVFVCVPSRGLLDFSTMPCVRKGELWFRVPCIKQGCLVLRISRMR